LLQLFKRERFTEWLPVWSGARPAARARALRVAADCGAAPAKNFGCRGTTKMKEARLWNRASLLLPALRRKPAVFL
jgi:hypothetical protein